MTEFVYALKGSVLRESHELEFAVVCVFVFELRMESVKLGDNAALFSVFFPCFPEHLHFPVEVAHRPECPPDDGADAAPYGAPEYATPLPPEQMQRKEYADYPAGHAIILHDKLPNIKAYFAAALGVSLSSVGQREQGRRRPDGASARLLSLIERHPELVSRIN